MIKQQRDKSWQFRIWMPHVTFARVSLFKSSTRASETRGSLAKEHSISKVFVLVLHLLKVTLFDGSLMWLTSWVWSNIIYSLQGFDRPQWLPGFYPSTVSPNLSKHMKWVYKFQEYQNKNVHWGCHPHLPFHQLSSGQCTSFASSDPWCSAPATQRPCLVMHLLIMLLDSL